MSDAKKCDRCGKFYEPYPDGQRVMNTDLLPHVAYYDLCPDCNDDLIDWVNRYREIVKPSDKVSYGRN